MNNSALNSYGGYNSRPINSQEGDDFSGGPLLYLAIVASVGAAALLIAHRVHRPVTTKRFPLGYQLGFNCPFIVHSCNVNGDI